MKSLIDYMEEAKVFYMATAEDNKPAVRPIGGKPVLGENGFVVEDGKIYFYTDKRKSMYKQMTSNPDIAMTFIVADGFVRLNAKPVFDNNGGVKEKMLEENKSLTVLYSLEDEFFEVYYLDDVSAFLFAKGQEPRKLA